MNRKEFIEYAKKDLRELKNEYTYELDFVVKRKQRTVYAYYTAGNGIFSKPLRGKAECRDGDTFNEYIGCAIAARRVLGLSLEAYESIPPCTELEQGSLLRHRTKKNILIYAKHGLACRLLEPMDTYVKGRLFTANEETLLLHEIFDDTGYLDDLETTYKLPNLQPQMLSCYDRKEHTCNLSCQGSIPSCPIVRSAYENTMYPTKKEMAAYIKTQRASQKAYEEILNSPALEGFFAKWKDRNN